MALDPRLAEPLLLVLAARRAKERQQAEPRRRVTLRVVYYDASGVEPLLVGPAYVYSVSETGGSLESRHMLAKRNVRRFPVALDARLAHVELLALAALRLK